MKASDNVFPKILISEGASVATPATGTIALFADANGDLKKKDDTGTVTPVGGGGGGGAAGDVVGPASAVADRIAVFDGGTGKLIKDGGMTVADLHFDSVTAATISAGTVTLDCNSGRARNFTVSMTENAALAVSNLAASGRVTEFECLITQDATGAHTLALPAAFRPLGGSDTAISAAAGARTVISAKTFDAGASWVYAMQEVG